MQILLHLLAVSRMSAVPEKAENFFIMLKYLSLDSSYVFVPVIVAEETCDVFGPKTKSFIQDLGHRLKTVTED